MAAQPPPTSGDEMTSNEQRESQVITSARTNSKRVPPQKLSPAELEANEDQNQQDKSALAPVSSETNPIGSGQLPKHQLKSMSPWRENSKNVLDPSGSPYYHWSMVVSFAFLYNFWSLSYRFAFKEIDFDSVAFWFALDYSADFIYILDIIINFHTGYLEDGVLERRVDKIGQHYRECTLFYLDCFCLLPLDIMYLSIGFNSILRITRLVKIYKFWSYIDRTERHTNYPNVFRTFTLVHYILVIFHWNACLFHMISKNKIIDIENLYKIDDNRCDDISCQYLHAFYWSTLALTMAGNLPRPRTKGEYLYLIIELFLGLFLFASVLGHVANIVTNVSAARKEFQAKLDAVKTFMRMRRVSDDLQNKVIRWFDYLWISQKSSDDDKSVACLPDRLKAEIAIHVHLDTLKRVDIFQNTEAGFLCELVLRLKPVLFSPGDYVCRKNEVGHEMYIVSRGILEVVTNEGKTVVATLKAGSYFGEISVLNVGLAGNKRTASVRSVGYSDLFCLNKQDLWDVLKNYPNAEARIRARAEERLSKLEINSGKDSGRKNGDRKPPNKRDDDDQDADEDGRRDDRGSGGQSPRRRLLPLCSSSSHYYVPNKASYQRRGNTSQPQYVRCHPFLDYADQYYSNENRSRTRRFDRDSDFMSERCYQSSRESQLLMQQQSAQHQPTCRHSQAMRLKDPKFRASFHNCPNRLNSRANLNSRDSSNIEEVAARRPMTLLPPQTYVSYSRSFDGRRSKLPGSGGGIGGSSRLNQKSLDTDDYALESPNNSRESSIEMLDDNSPAGTSNNRIDRRAAALATVTNWPTISTTSATPVPPSDAVSAVQMAGNASANEQRHYQMATTSKVEQLDHNPTSSRVSSGSINSSSHSKRTAETTTANEEVDSIQGASRSLNFGRGQRSTPTQHKSLAERASFDESAKNQVAYRPQQQPPTGCYYIATGSQLATTTANPTPTMTTGAQVFQVPLFAATMPDGRYQMLQPVQLTQADQSISMTQLNTTPTSTLPTANISSNTGSNNNNNTSHHAVAIQLSLGPAPNLANSVQLSRSSQSIPTDDLRR